MAISIKTILEDNRSGSLTIARNTLDLFREWLLQCSASNENPGECFKTIQDASKALLKKQPNMALLRYCCTTFLQYFKRALKTESDPGNGMAAALAKLTEIRKEMEHNTERIADIGAKLIASSNKLMTISSSTLVNQILIKASSAKKRFHVYNLKSHPPDEGVHSAEFLLEHNIKTTLIADAEMGLFMPQMNLVLIGADRVFEDGFVNKAGTLPLLVTAKHFNIPVYLAFDTWKILSKNDKTVKFMERENSEIYSNKIHELHVQNFYFESIPLNLVQKVICEEGVYETSEFIDWYLKG